MATTLEQEMARATDPAFVARVRAAIYRRLPNVLGEAIGGAVTSETVRAKRHAWACDARDRPEVWSVRLAAMLAGEPAAQAIDGAQSLVTDGIIDARLNALINDAAGVQSTD